MYLEQEAAFLSGRYEKARGEQKKKKVKNTDENLQIQ